jgi:hypothetical protein
MLVFSRRFFAAAAAAVLLTGPTAAFAVDIAPGGNLRTAIAALKPGEELRLAGGTYTVDSGFRVTVNGTAQQPIVMRSKDGERAIIQQTNSGQNVFEISGSKYFVVRNIEFTGGSHRHSPDELQQLHHDRRLRSARHRRRRDLRQLRRHLRRA